MHKVYTNSNWLRIQKNKLRLSSLQKDILIGTLLGDGYLRLSRSGTSARLQICHSYKSKNYLLWLLSVFDNFVFTKPDYQISNKSWRFTTISHDDFLVYYELFYRYGIKQVPSNIKDYLTSPLSLAVWFMDDGNGYQDKKSYRISTYAFGIDGNTILQNCLESNFGLQTSLVRDSKGYQLYFPAKNGTNTRFKKLISQFVIPSMKYKLMHNSPVETNMVDVGR